ncbi:MAG: ABC transporter ATP-binding protein [Firmicutes bacterium]|jgi:putative ABC transport system ATP-binding protein|nr:ABC transporter ATP-binding protein [Bacillota bacterium]
MIRVRHLTKDYRLGSNTFRALHDVTFDVETGAMVAIMGQSGSGKTTLMNVLGGLDTPTDGQYWLNGREVGRFDPVTWSHIRNRTIGFVFQNFNLVPTLTAIGNVELPLIYRRVPPRIRRTRAVEVLGAMGLGERLHHYPTQLSGGQQQRVAIARALVGDPPLLLADEPTGNLDVNTGREILSVLQELHQAGRTVVVVTHAPEVAAVCERVLRMQDGRMEAQRFEEDAHELE